MKHLMLILLILASVATARSVDDSFYKQHGDYKIFYSAFGSSFLTPEIAVANHIVRGKDKGLVNIAVVKQLGQGLPAKVIGEVSNIFQQTQTLEFTQVKEQDTLYYLAPFEFANEDYLTFKITVLPNPEKGASAGTYSFKFQKKMYHN